MFPVPSLSYSSPPSHMKLFTKRQSHTNLVASNIGPRAGLGTMTVPMWIVWTIAVVGWWVAFVSMCVGESKLSECLSRADGQGVLILGCEDAATGGPAMGTLWFAIIFQAAVIVHLTYVPCTSPKAHHSLVSFFRLATVRSNLPIHRLQLCFFLAILIVFAVNGVEYIYQGQSRSRANLDGAGALKAVGAGWLMLAIVDVSFTASFINLA